jgi:hypothetical protein
MMAFIGNRRLHFTTNENLTLSFVPLRNEDGLPFPLFLSDNWKMLMTIWLSMILVFGLRLRIGIVAYLRAPDTMIGRLDYLIWMDQVRL